MGNSQPKVIETIVTCILLYSYWTTLTCVVVLLIDDGSGGSSIQKLKREGVLQIDNEKEMKTAVLPHSWCWQQRNFSSTQPFHQGDGFRWSDQWSAVIRLWYASPIHPYTEPIHRAFSHSSPGTALYPYILLLSHLHISHPLLSSCRMMTKTSYCPNFRLLFLLLASTRQSLLPFSRLDLYYALKWCDS